MLRSLLMAGSAAALAFSALPASAQTAAAPPTITVGATVYDTAGGTVGTVDAVNGGNAVVSTGTHKVAIPATSFGKSDKGLLLGMTKAQLDAAAEGAAAKTAAAVTAGAAVVDSQGAPVGTIKSVDSQYAVVDMSSAQVKLPLNAFAARDNGLMLGMTKAQLEAAAGAAAPAPAADQAAPPQK